MVDSMITAKQTKFVEHFIDTGNATESARRAGYSANSAKVTACRLLNNPDIAAVVRTKRCKIEAEHQLTRARIIKGLLNAINIAEDKADAGALIAGWRELGKMMGYYQPSRAVLRVNPVNKSAFANLEKLSNEELIQMLEPGKE